MRWVRHLFNRIRAWLFGTTEAPEIDPQVGSAIAELLNAGVKGRDWFLWECEQLRQVGYVWWLDPYRYEGTEWAYPLPTLIQRSANFEASRHAAISRFGQERVNAAVTWGAATMDGLFDPFSPYAQSADPIGMVVRAWQLSHQNGSC
jgi:hypothetical protein